MYLIHKNINYLKCEMIQTHIHYYKKGSLSLCGLCLDDMYEGYVGRFSYLMDITSSFY